MLEIYFPSTWFDGACTAWLRSRGFTVGLKYVNDKTRQQYCAKVSFYEVDQLAKKARKAQ